jgi:hypothetical protein
MKKKRRVYLRDGKGRPIHVGRHAGWCDGATIVRIIVWDQPFVWHPPPLRVEGTIFVLAKHHRIKFCVAEQSNTVVAYENISLWRSD